MQEQEIALFWEDHPVGDRQSGGPESGDYRNFFQRYDDFRFHQHGHLLDCLDAIDFRDKKVLEIGLGQGADSEQIIRRGGIWSGLDITPESCKRVGLRLHLHDLPYDQVVQGSVLDMEFPDDSFDIVYSHGVLHHVPDINQAQKEIARVLKPDGELVIMVYAKWSLNYLVSIAMIRRLGLLAAYALPGKRSGIIGEHVENARQMGLGNYLSMDTFIHRNTDGPFNPYSKVYDLELVRKDFPDFEITKSYKRFMHAPPLPVKSLPLEQQLGWHLWVHLKPKH